MGAGSYDYAASTTRASLRATTGKSAFEYTKKVESGEAKKSVHDTLDLHLKPIRESRDVVGKPPSTPIIVGCDVTGSMRELPKSIIAELGKLMKLVVEGEVVTDPQICFAGIGDATSDNSPLMVGEFEADDELAEKHLSNIHLEGGGGGGYCESYELLMAFAAYQTKTDAWELRGDKGFLFMIGDEAPYPKLSKEFSTSYGSYRGHTYESVMGVPLEEEITLEKLAVDLQEKWNVFLIMPAGSSKYNATEVVRVWEKILPEQNILRAKSWQDVVPMIAATISIVAGQSLDETVAALKDSGFDASSIKSTSTELTRLADSSALTVNATGLLPAIAGAGEDAPVASRL